jgi:drug/metabolite transporter (DMT)-like permease
MKKGLKLAFLTSIISGISVFTNGLFITQVDPFIFALLRNLAVAIILSLYISLSAKKIEIKNLSKSNWLNLILVGLVGGGLPFALFFSGLAQIGSSAANIINKSLFLWVAVLAIIFLKERLHWLSIIGYGVLFSALFWGTKISISVGLLLVLGATVFWAIEHIIAKIILKDISPLILCWARMVFGLPALGVVWLVYGKILPVMTYGLVMSLIVSSLLLILYMLTWYSAIKNTRVSLVSSVLVLAPLVTIILNSLLKSKYIFGEQIFFIILSMVGVSFIILPGIFKSKKGEESYGV